jgi:hypothetical protein
MTALLTGNPGQRGMRPILALDSWTLGESMWLREVLVRFLVMQRHVSPRFGTPLFEAETSHTGLLAGVRGWKRNESFCVAIELVEGVLEGVELLASLG